MARRAKALTGDTMAEDTVVNDTPVVNDTTDLSLVDPASLGIVVTSGTLNLETLGEHKSEPKEIAVVNGFTVVSY